MSKAELNRFLDMALSETAKDHRVYLVGLKARLRIFEDRYEIRSRDLPRALKEGSIRETKEVGSWLFWAELYGLLARKTRPKPAR